tara:strand:+ start:2194 stop:2376 length:183 start_codon:yes stop_codon:yes gene_type:complete
MAILHHVNLAIKIGELIPKKNPVKQEVSHTKKWQATYITPLQHCTLAAFPPWGISKELVV